MLWPRQTARSCAWQLSLARNHLHLHPHQSCLILRSSLSVFARPRLRSSRFHIEAIFKTLHTSTVSRLSAACESASKGEATHNDARALCGAVTTDVGGVLAALRPLVQLGADVMHDMPAVFSGLVQGQVQSFFLWLNAVLERMAENDDRSAIIAVAPLEVEDDAAAAADGDGEDGTAAAGGGGGGSGGGGGGGGGGSGGGSGGTLDVEHDVFDVELPKRAPWGPESAGVALMLAAIARQVEDQGVADAVRMLTDHLPYLQVGAPGTRRWVGFGSSTGRGIGGGGGGAGGRGSRGRGRGRHKKGRRGGGGGGGVGGGGDSDNDNDNDGGGGGGSSSPVLLDVAAVIKRARLSTQRLLHRYVFVQKACVLTTAMMIPNIANHVRGPATWPT
jgi:hypothetical protein